MREPNGKEKMEEQSEQLKKRVKNRRSGQKEGKYVNQREGEF